MLTRLAPVLALLALAGCAGAPGGGGSPFAAGHAIPGFVDPFASPFAPTAPRRMDLSLPPLGSGSGVQYWGYTELGQPTYRAGNLPLKDCFRNALGTVYCR